MIYEHTHYRNFLRSVLAERTGKNPSYSLRAFANQLGVSHATLSQVIRGNKNFSYDRALEVGSRLGLEKNELEYFSLSVQFETAKSPESKRSIQEKMNTIRPASAAKVYDLSVDYFKTISDWYHFAILQLTRLKSFSFTPKNIAKRLKISTVEAETAIERLMRLELLEKISETKYARAENRLMISSPHQDQAINKFHQQFLEKAIDALHSQTPKEKITGSETFAISPQRVDQVRALTEEYFKKILKFAGDQKDPTEIYHLQVNFFRLTQPDGKEKP